MNFTSVTEENEHSLLFKAARFECSYFGGAAGYRQHKLDFMRMSDRFHLTGFDTIHSKITGESNYMEFDDCARELANITDVQF